MSPRIFYFGCWADAGHYLHEPDGRRIYREARGPWAQCELDCTLCPGYSPRAGAGGEQIEGEAALHHLDGWTALAFWDRSVDPRGGSNSVFVAEGTLDGDAMIALASAMFPTIWARFTFDVVVAGTPAGSEQR